MPSSGLDDDYDNNNHRVLIERRRSYAPSVPPLSLNDDGLFFPSFSFSYHQLPKQLLKLSVLKLDASSFDVHVARNATIAELKLAVEEVFSLSPRADEGKISWSHVWGHFCLCFEGQKLVNDKAYIRNFGIKDGDQLQFIRHMSFNYEPAKRESKNQHVACKQYLMLSSESNAYEEREQTCADGDDEEDQEDSYKYYRYEDDDDEVPMPEFKLAHFLRGWLSYSRLWGVTRKGSEGRTRPSRFAVHCLGGFKGN